MNLFKYSPKQNEQAAEINLSAMIQENSSKNSVNILKIYERYYGRS